MQPEVSPKPELSPKMVLRTVAVSLGGTILLLPIIAISGVVQSMGMAWNDVLPLTLTILALLLLVFAPKIGILFRKPEQPDDPYAEKRLLLERIVAYAVWEASAIIAFLSSTLTGDPSASIVLSAAAASAIWRSFPRSE